MKRQFRRGLRGSGVQSEIFIIANLSRLPHGNVESATVANISTRYWRSSIVLYHSIGGILNGDMDSVADGQTRTRPEREREKCKTGPFISYSSSTAAAAVTVSSNNNT